MDKSDCLENSHCTPPCSSQSNSLQGDGEIWKDIVEMERENIINVWRRYFKIGEKTIDREEKFQSRVQNIIMKYRIQSHNLFVINKVLCNVRFQYRVSNVIIVSSLWIMFFPLPYKCII